MSCLVQKGFPVVLMVVTASLGFGQGLPPEAKSGAKVCVAIVGNESSTSALVERLTARLTKNLADDKLTVISLESRTSGRYPLELSAANGDESKEKECDYVLLTQIRDPKQHPLEAPSQISIGRRPPSTDASDPLGGSSGPVTRDNLEVAFALFRIGRFKPVLDANVMDTPSANVSDTLMTAMDREANRVARELKKR